MAARVSSTRMRVAELLSRGVPRADIARQLGLSKATISYHARRLGGSVDERCARRYDHDTVQRYYDHGHSVRQCMESFGFSSASCFDAVKRGAIVPRPAAIAIAALLAAGTYRGRFNLKLRLLREGLKEDRCERCGLTEWRGEALTLALHHESNEPLGQCSSDARCVLDDVGSNSAGWREPAQADPRSLETSWR